jgi:hypothetical protein
LLRSSSPSRAPATEAATHPNARDGRRQRHFSSSGAQRTANRCDR